jgi:hypothetical protein
VCLDCYCLPPSLENKQATEQEKALLHRYLNSVISKSKDLNPTGIHQSQALLSVNVPLEDIFIHIRAVSDRPVFDIGIERQKLLDEIEQVRHRPDLEAGEREDFIQTLGAAMWHSQLGEELFTKRLGKEVNIEDVLQRLTPTRPAAVILGTPGSGKSTTLRWLALHMARASRHADYSLPENLAPVLLPIFLTIGDYAKAITAPPSAGSRITSVREFFRSEWMKISPDLPSLLENALLKGRCLLLFEGLDEVASDSLRGHVRKDPSEFISLYLPEEDNASEYSRTLITSRIVGYEPGPFAPFAQYTLLDLNDKQIQQFLDSWCPAVERYQARSLQGMQEELTPQQEQRALQEGHSQRDRLLEALNHNPGIRRLAINPLMLTILALIQKSGRRLPHRRIELYQTVTLTLLNNWNQYRGGVIFSPEEIDLAEEVLSEFAYQLHSHDLPLTEKEVFAMTRETMARYYRRALEQIQRADVEQFIETLRSSSLFVERGQGLYGFLHRTFQEYYAMRYLVDKQHYSLIDKSLTPAEDLKAFVAQKCHISTWHEPLLLLIAYKSEQKDRGERPQATALIETILATRDSYDIILQRQLLLTANALIDCNPWYIDIPIQQQVASQLLDVYGDAYGAGRYTQLQKDIEKTALLWLRGQPTGSDQRPPLLETLHSALCDDTNSHRQHGATKLLASIAPELPTCPAIVLHTLVPPLLHLAGVQDWYRQELTCPQAIRPHLFSISARPYTMQVAEYAIVALCLLDSHGPAGWLHADWLRWSEEQPELLERLTQHSIELDYLITPSAFPGRRDDVNWNTQLNLRLHWKEQNHSDLLATQRQLLQASRTAQYPYAYHFWKMLKREDEEVHGHRSWKEVWLNFLEKEVLDGYGISLQLCLYLKYLLIGEGQEQYKKTANDLVASLTSFDIRQVQIVLNTISSIFQTSLLIEMDLSMMLDEQGDLSLPDISIRPDPLTLIWGPDSPILLDPLRLKNAQLMLDARNTVDRKKTWPYYSFLIDLQNAFDVSQSINTLINLLLHPSNPGSSMPFEILFALYSIIDKFKNEPFTTTDRKKIIEGLQRFKQETKALPIELYQMVVTIKQRIQESFSSTNYSITPDERALNLRALEKTQHLTVLEIKELLNACTDERSLSRDFNDESSVRQVAEKLLFINFDLTDEGVLVLTEALDNEDEQICAAASQILKSNYKKLTDTLRENVVQKIVNILKDNKQSYYLILFGDIDGAYITEPLYDLIFETLQALTE